MNGSSFKEKSRHPTEIDHICSRSLAKQQLLFSRLHQRHRRSTGSEQITSPVSDSSGANFAKH
eukprot:3945853-Pyramimonas_sp.AAC.1